jgi:hypothetical protein
MGPSAQSLEMYRELAEWYERLGQNTMRDRFLMLAADTAMQLNQPDEAERLRLKLLQGSRHHMLRPYASWTEAASAPDVQAYLRDLRLNYPPDVAEQLLATLKQGSGGGASGGQPLDQTRPLPWQAPPPSASARPIPYTAPLLDTSEPSPASTPRPRVVRPLADPYPLADESQPMPTMPPPKAAPRAAPPAQRPIPLAAPVGPPPEPPAPPPVPKNGAAWLNAALVGITFLVALAALALTFGRPFVPAEWLK